MRCKTWNSLLTFALISLLSSAAQATVIESTQMKFEGFSQAGGNYYATTYPLETSAGWNGLAFYFDPVQLTIQSLSFGTLGGIQTQWYQAQPGTVFDEAAITAGTVQSISTPRQISSPDFYLAVRLTLNVMNPNAPLAYGWLHLQTLTINPFPTGLVQKGNAIAYYNTGIVVGSVIEVPEPSSWLLCGIGIAAFALRVFRPRIGL